MSNMTGDSLIIPRQEKGCALVENLKVEDLQSSEEEVIEISPCTSERGEVMAEIDLSHENGSRFLDMKILCHLLESYKDRFAEMKCSQELGVGRLMWKARRIYLYENGKFKVRFAYSKEDAIQTLNSTIRLIYGSIICDKCGRPTIDCIFEKCEECKTDKSVQTISLDDYFNGPLLIKGVENLRESMEESRKLRREFSLKENKWPTNIEKSMERKLRATIENAMNFSLKSQRQEAPRIGVVLISIALKNLILLDKMRTLTGLMEDGALGKSKTLIYELNSSLWQLQEDLVSGIQGRGNRGRANGEISKCLETMRKLRSSLKGKGPNDKNYEMILEELMVYINDSEKFLAKIKSEKHSG